MDALTALLSDTSGTHTSYVRDLLPGDFIVWEGEIVEVMECYKAPVGWMLCVSGGYDYSVLGYRTVQKY
jgi:hypothetical protein